MERDWESELKEEEKSRNREGRALEETAVQKYYDWIKQMLSLSFAALTALGALQGNYRPDNNLARFLLWGTFASLAASVVASAIILLGQVGTTYDLATRLMSEPKMREREMKLYAALPPRYAKHAMKCLPWLLSLSVLFLFAFSVANSFTPRESVITPRHTAVRNGSLVGQAFDA
jgi:hypothetical protein